MQKGHNYGICKVCGRDHGLNPMLGKHHTEENKKKMGVANKGKHLSEEHKKKIGDARRGKKSPMYGKHHSEESREKISVAEKELWDDPIYRTKLVAGRNTPEARANNSKKKKENWVNGVYSNHSEKIGAQWASGAYSGAAEKISIANKENWANGVYDGNSEKLKENWANGAYIGVFISPTSIEVMLREFLDSVNILYSTGKAINIGYKTRVPDAFIEPNIILEADGEYYHSENNHGRNKKADDKKADKIMKKMGYIIYRIPEGDFRNGNYLETLNMIVTVHHLKPNL